ncbi:MAG: SpoIIE family protein phosphatase [Bacteroidales bacterium]|nr:SpoIIE family protein phosphatase [Bacteroidales bacterium]
MKSAGKHPPNNIYIFVAFLFISFNSFGQNNSIETLKSKLKTSKDYEKSAISYQIALSYFASNDELCEFYANESIKYAKKNTQTNELIDSYHLLAEYYIKNANYKDAVKNYENEYEKLKTTTRKKDIAMVLFNLGQTNNILGREKKSTDYLEESLLISESINYKYLIKRIYNLLYEINYDRKKYKEAIEYLTKYMEIAEYEYKNEKELKIEEANMLIALKDSIIDEQETDFDSVTVINNELNTLSNEQQLEIKNLNLENQLNKEKLSNQKLSILLLILFIVFIAVIAFLILIQLRQKKKINEVLTIKSSTIKQQNEEIKTQIDKIQSINQEIIMSRDIIQEKNRSITQSIKYAKRIQKAVFPAIQILNETFSEHFIFFKPKDIVSGDFYWLHKNKDKVYVIAGDCTGHGIPGAFMSLLSISFLNEIVPNSKSLNAGEILDLLRHKIKTTLHQNSNTDGQKDGLDVSFCIIDHDSLSLEFAGANIPIYIVREKDNVLDCKNIKNYKLFESENISLIEIKGDKQPVAIHIKEKPFANQKINLQKEDKLYMFSDGYSDQFGGKNNSKFMSRNFKKLLVEIYSESMDEQNKILHETLSKWQKNTEQVDDILVLGLKI